MKRIRLGVALFVTIVLVGGATFVRFSHRSTASNNLAVVNGDAHPSATLTDADYQAAAADLSVPASSTSSQQVSDTDLISQQLITDYLSLAATGQATDDSIQNLANKYAIGIADLHTSRSATLSNLTVITDSRTAMQTYSDQVSAVYNKYQGLAREVLATSGDLNTSDPASFASTMSSIGLLYGRAVNELEVIPVPQSIAEDHLSLVNAYLLSEQAFTAVAQGNKDSVDTYAVLSQAAATNGNEDAALLAIRADLLSQGILFQAGS